MEEVLKMKAKVYFSIILLILVIFVNINTLGQTVNNNILGKSIEEISINDKNLTSVLVEISDRYNIPIGFEYSDYEHTEKIRISLSEQNTTVKDVLNLLITQNSNYNWEISDGVINFIPTKARRESLKRLLTTEISITFNKNLTKYELKSFLAELPEIKKISDSPFNFKIHSGNVSDQLLSDETLKTAKNIQFKSFLNRIVNGKDSNFWFISEIGDQDSVFNLEF